MSINKLCFNGFSPLAVGSRLVRRRRQSESRNHACKEVEKVSLSFKSISSVGKLIFSPPQRHRKWTVNLTTINKEGFFSRMCEVIDFFVIISREILGQFASI